MAATDEPPRWAVPVSVRMPPELAQRLRTAAKEQGSTMTDLVVRACQAAPWGHEPQPEIVGYLYVSGDGPQP